MKIFHKIVFVVAVCAVVSNADFLSSGLSLVTGGQSSQGQSNLIKDSAMPFLFDMLSKQTFGEFPFQGGRLTNIQLQVIPPESMEQVTVDMFSDTLVFGVKGIGAIINADFEVIIKGRPATGHINIQSNDIGVKIHLKNEPGSTKDAQKVGADIKLDLEHTHSNVIVTAEGSVEEIKAYLIEMVKKEATKTASSYLPEWTSGFNWRAGGVQQVGSIHDVLKERTQEVVDHYFDHHADMDDSKIMYQSPSRSVDADHGLSKYSNLFSAPQVVSLKDRLIKNNIEMFASRDSKSGIKDRLRNNAGHIDHHSSRGKLDYAVTPYVFSTFFVQSESRKPVLNQEMVKKLLTRDNSIDKKVQKYFGDKVAFDCQPTNRDPELRIGDGDSIIGSFVVICSLKSPNSDSEPVYKSEMNLEFVIHPDNKEDGRSPKDSFGEFADVDMDMTENGDISTTIRINDEPESFILFPGFDDLFGGLFIEMEESP